MNYGAKLELRFVDPKTDRIHYTEPFVLESSYQQLASTMEAFRTGCEDALQDIHRDIARSAKFGTFSDWDLAAELAARGYDVKKRC